MTLTQLRYFLAIVDTGLNITLAAKRVHATQPGLSKQLRLLEDELGLLLFVRRGRNLERLTVAGQEVADRARSMLGEADNIRALAANQRAEAGGLLTIETTHVHAQFVLPPALAALRHAFPLVDVALGFSADADDLARRNPDADVAIFSTDGRVPAGDVAIPLYAWDQVAVVPTDHPLARLARPITLADLARYPLVTYDTSKTAPLSVGSRFGEAGLAPRFAYAVRDAEVIKNSVRSGLGVGILAEMGVRRDGEPGLVTIPLAELFPRCTAWAVFPRDRVLRDHTLHLITKLSGLSARSIGRLAQGGEGHHRPADLPLWVERSRELRAGTIQPDPPPAAGA